MKSMDFWFSIGSTHTCLTVMCLHACASEDGLTFNWRPHSTRVCHTDN